MSMVDESEPTDYNICQNLWRNVPRNASEHRRDLYCIFAKLVKQNNIILSPDLANSICQHVVDSQPCEQYLSACSRIVK